MAFPKYPELKSSLEKFLLDRFEATAREELGPFRDVRRFTQHEGKKLIHNTQDDTEKQRETGFASATADYQIKFKDVPEMAPQDVLKIIDDQAKEFGGQQARINYQVLDQTTRDTGNVVDGTGQPLTVDLILDTISKISISFDKFGNPQMPTMVIPSSQADKYRQLIEDAENDEDAKKRMEAIIEQKRKEFNAEQASRKLVD